MSNEETCDETIKVDNSLFTRIRRSFVRLPWLQLFTVTFGVLLGFWINGLRQSFHEKRVAKVAIYQVNKEMLVNLNSIEDAILRNLKEYRHLLDLDLSVANTRNKCFHDVFRFPFVMPSFSSGAYESAIQQGIASKMPIDMLISLANINRIYLHCEKIDQRVAAEITSQSSLQPLQLNGQVRLFKILLFESLNQNVDCRKMIISYFQKYNPSYLKDTLPVIATVKKTLTLKERQSI